MYTFITQRLVPVLAAPALASAILIGGLALGTAPLAVAAPAGSGVSTCFTTGSMNATPNAASPLTRPGQMGLVEPSIGIYARPTACFGN